MTPKQAPRPGDFVRICVEFRTAEAMSGKRFRVSIRSRNGDRIPEDIDSGMLWKGQHGSRSGIPLSSSRGIYSHLRHHRARRSALVELSCVTSQPCLRRATSAQILIHEFENHISLNARPPQGRRNHNRSRAGHCLTGGQKDQHGRSFPFEYRHSQTHQVRHPVDSVHHRHRLAELS